MIDIEELKAEMEQEKQLEKDDSPTLLKELDDVATSASGAVGIVMLGTLIFDAIKNKNSESGERLFQGSLGWLLGIGGSALVGISIGRLGRGSIAQKEAESFTNMIHKIEEDYEAEKEAEEERKAEQNTQVNNQAMMLTNPENFTLAPLAYDMGLGFGEYGNAVGQSLLTYAQK
jgi:hypothetical protein